MINKSYFCIILSNEPFVERLRIFCQHLFTSLSLKIAAGKSQRQTHRPNFYEISRYITEMSENKQEQTFQNIHLGSNRHDAINLRKKITQIGVLVPE